MRALCLISLLIFALNAAANIQQSMELTVEEEFSVVIDESKKLILPRNFRTTADPYKAKLKTPPSRLGLTELRASASAQFSEKSFHGALQAIQKPFIVVDLRQESHGFVNGLPVSHYTYRNRENDGKTAQEIAKIESEMLREINQGQNKKIFQLAKQGSGEVELIEPVAVKVKRIESEQELIQRLGGEYYRFYVLDHYPPTLEQIDEFLSFVENLPQDTWIHFHCRGGRGRATTFMTLYDIFHNGDKVTLSEIIQRQFLIGGRPLTKIDDDPETAWKKKPAEARLKLVTEFYKYRNNQSVFPKIKFSEWYLQNNPNSKA